MIPAMTTAEQIVRALAAAVPRTHYDRGECNLCEAMADNTVGAVDQHEPDCQWRLAVEWVAAQDGQVVEYAMDDPALPYHLRLDAPPLASCDVCGRATWSDEGGACGMPQPDGRLCAGLFRGPPPDEVRDDRGEAGVMTDNKGYRLRLTHPDGPSMEPLFGLPVATSEAVEQGMIFLAGPSPRREDFATDADYYEASARRFIRIAVADIARP